jgi:hypothetical protein
MCARRHIHKLNCTHLNFGLKETKHPAKNTCAHIRTYVRTYIHTYIHTYVCIHTYIHTYNSRLRTDNLVALTKKFVLANLVFLSCHALRRLARSAGGVLAAAGESARMRPSLARYRLRRSFCISWPCSLLASSRSTANAQNRSLCGCVCVCMCRYVCMHVCFTVYIGLRMFRVRWRQIKGKQSKPLRSQTKETASSRTRSKQSYRPKRLRFSLFSASSCARMWLFASCQQAYNLSKSMHTCTCIYLYVYACMFVTIRLDRDRILRHQGRM